MPHGIQDHLDALSTGGLADLLCKVLLGVENSLVCSGLLGHLSLGFGGDGGEDVDAQAFQQLDQQQAHPARSGVDQHLVAGVEPGDAKDQEVGGHPLKE